MQKCRKLNSDITFSHENFFWNMKKVINLAQMRFRDCVYINKD